VSDRVVYLAAILQVGLNTLVLRDRLILDNSPITAAIFVLLLFIFLFFAVLGGFARDDSFLTEHLLLAVLMVLLLDVHLCAKLFEIFVGLFKDLKKARVLLGVDHVDVGVEVVVFEGLDSVSLVFVLHHLLLLLFGLERGLD
jgi:hypothetical protein